jgi:hypothetical protein
MFHVAPNLRAASLALLAASVAAGGCGHDGGAGGGAVDLGRPGDGGSPGALDMTTLVPCTPSGPLTLRNLVPLPVSVDETGGAFCLAASAEIRVDADSAELAAIGQALAARLRPATGYALPVNAAAGTPAPGGIQLTLSGGDPALGDEGYQLSITTDLVRVVAYRPAGVFHAIQNRPCGPRPS